MVVKHEIGHLPFEADVTDALKYGEENRITVLCDNALLANTIPQGKITEMARYALIDMEKYLSTIWIDTWIWIHFRNFLSFFEQNFQILF